MSANMKAKMVMVEGALATAEKVCAYYKVEGHIKLAALGAFSRNCILAVIEKKHKDLPFLTLSKLPMWTSFRASMSRWATQG